MKRRDFLACTAAAAAIGGCSRPARWKGGIVGGAHGSGHRLRGNQPFPKPARVEQTDVVIVGGGIAGLTAGLRLKQRGIAFTLLELERLTGGTAASGQSDVSPHPWGAHYVPVPNAESTEVLALLEEFGVIVGRAPSGLPIYDETVLCADPAERIYHYGRWQEGIVPQLGLDETDRAQLEGFFAEMERLRQARGSDGRRAFAIPLDLSSQDEAFIAFDRQTMRAWLDERGFTSPALRWYVDYCCRDDFGAGIEHVSAWAGVHYFASRNGVAANAGHDDVLTWPAGNGWLAGRLAEQIHGHIRTDALAWRVENVGDGVEVDYMRGQECVRVKARAAICAAPRFVVQRIVPGLAPISLEYSPWMVANVTLAKAPAGDGARLAWDNVIRDSKSLGYVVATHQSLRSVPGPTVLTHYWPLDGQDPRAARESALTRSYEEWCEWVVGDLERVHPGIAGDVRALDVWLWGHGMIRPVPGFIHGAERRAMSEPHGRVYFAHSDMSGISIFEEACTRGAAAAASVIQLLS